MNHNKPIAITLILTLGLLLTIGCFGLFAEEKTKQNRIYDWNDLDEIRENPSEEYILMEDLDKNTAGYDEVVRNSETGWDPIGSSGEPFNGKFNGNSYTISDLEINETNTDNLIIGLFGYVGSEGKIHKLNLENVNIVREGPTISDLEIGIGTLVGYNEGKIINNNINNGKITADRNTGGLIGRNNGKIRNSTSNIEVKGDRQTGGLVGFNRGNIINSQAEGSIIGEYYYTGGLVGRNDGNISESYARGNIEAQNDVGGLVGHNYKGKVSESYAIGEVTGEQDTGGIIGSNSDGSIKDSYWNKETTNQDEAIGDDRGESENLVGLTTDEMTGTEAERNMDALDFLNTWTTVTNDYPILQWQED